MPLTPEQQAQIERAAEMLEGYAAHLYKLMPFNPDEHPYIPSIEEAAGEMRAIAAQIEAQEAPSEPSDGEIYERVSMAHASPEMRAATQAHLDAVARELLHAPCECVKCLNASGETADFLGMQIPIAGTRMVVCGVCGNKRCPHATDCALTCTNSNEPGQPGSAYGPPLVETPRPAMSQFVTVADYKAAVAKHEAKK